MGIHGRSFQVAMDFQVSEAELCQYLNKMIKAGIVTEEDIAIEFGVFIATVKRWRRNEGRTSPPLSVRKRVVDWLDRQLCKSRP